MSEQLLGRPVQLGPDWLAVMLPTGEVLLQQVSQALSPSGHIAPLEQIGVSNPEAAKVAYIRTLQLMPDGSVYSDPHSMSPSGLPSPNHFQMIPPIAETAQILVTRKQWMHNPTTR